MPSDPQFTKTAENSTGGVASLDELFELHRAVARSFLSKLKDDTATAADRAAATQFLRLNGVFRGGVLSPSEMGEAMKEVYQGLPRFDDDDALDKITALTTALN